MALMTWSQEYSVGVQSIDGQHSGLFAILNDLGSAATLGKARQVTGVLLRKLVDSTRFNFQVEELLMASTNYPGLPQHRIRHYELTRRVNEFVSRWEKGEAAIDEQLLEFLCDWLANHIQSDDKQYGPWLNEHGVR